MQITLQPHWARDLLVPYLSIVILDTYTVPVEWRFKYQTGLEMLSSWCTHEAIQ